MTTQGTPWYKNPDILGGIIAPVAGAAIGAVGQNQQSNANRQFNREQAALDALLLQQQREQQARTALAGAGANLHTEGLNDQFRRSSNYLDAAPVGWAQDYERKNALLAALAPALRDRANAANSMMPADEGVRAQMGDIPSLNIDLSRFLRATSEGATAASIGDRERGLQQLMQGSGPATSMTQLYGNSPAALSQMEQSKLWADDLRTRAQEKDDLNRQYVLGGLEGNLNQATDWRKQQEQQYQQDRQKQQTEEQKKKKSGGILGFLGKIAPFAAMAIPFVGPAVGMGALAAGATSAGLGALGGAANGGLKGALLGGAAGGLGAAAGPIAGRVGGSAVQQALVRGGVNAAAGGLSGGFGGAASGALGGLLSPRQPPQPAPGSEFPQYTTGGPLPTGFLTSESNRMPAPPTPRGLASYAGTPGYNRQFGNLFPQQPLGRR